MSKPLLLLILALSGASLTAAPADAQIGPFPAIGEQPASPLPKEDQQREARNRARAQAEASAAAPAAPIAAAPAGKLSACLSTIDANPGGAAEAAGKWLGDAKGAERVDAAQCLGSAQVALEEFGDARASFVTARDAAAPGDHASRARLGAMAGSAALADGDPATALAALDAARGEAGQIAGGADAGAEKTLRTGIAIDRARALVALKRDGEAVAALSEARSTDPENAEAWLLSATLSRRVGRLEDAQRQIERAAALAPVDPQVGLEAGVIAMLAGHADAARKSWQSVVAAAPQGPSAATAQGYLAQLGGSNPAASAKEASR